MKKLLAVFALATAFAAGAFLTAQVRDWQDLENVHKEVQQAIQDLDRARAANHYDMQGHGTKAEAALKEAERELGLAVRAAREAR